MEMFTYVKDDASNRLFFDILQQTWEEKFGKGIMKEVYKGEESDKVILFNDQEEGIGTFELIPYHPTVSKMDFNFHTLSEIRRCRSVMEIDKFTVLKEHASLNAFGEAVIAMMDYSLNNNVHYYVYCIQPDLLKVLQLRYGFPIKPVGEEILIYDPTDPTKVIGKEVPAVVDMQYLMTHLDEFKRVKRLYNRRKIILKLKRD